MSLSDSANEAKQTAEGFVEEWNRFRKIDGWIVGPWVKGSTSFWAFQHPCSICQANPKPHVHSLRSNGEFGAIFLWLDDQMIEGPMG